jgi:predicted dehydrogenase/threonine dehydrogenase-like Zn-dependent dehydrogenase
LKQIAQYQDGRLELQDVPLPSLSPGGIRVRLTHSVISAGTERMKVEQARMNLLQKARARPDQVRKVLDTARNLGWRAALDKVRNRLETPTPLGYSAAGIVDSVDSANTRFRVGDHVACGGAECAFHAEYVAVPDLLAARVPDGVEGWQAAYTTIAAIALQTVRQLQPNLGDRVLVLGQGLVGLLVTNLLAASGCRVMAMDVAQSRRAPALAMGAERFVIAATQSLADEVRAWTDGIGVDGAVLATATSLNTPTEQAIDAARDRARIVVVGNTRVDLPWKAAYEKELEIRYSRSYGPGRYDPAYEWAGADYPVGYVRWTEQRNLEACLHLMRNGALRLDVITSRRVPFTQCLEVYRQLASGSSDIGVVLEYDTAQAPNSPPTAIRDGDGLVPVASITSSESTTSAASPRRTQGIAREAARVAPVARVDVIGAGNFARTMLLPHLQGRIHLGTVVNNTALSGNHVREKFGFESAGTDADAVLGSHNDNPAAVLIATRHHLHARFVTGALARHRDVFVEKPLCLTRGELRQIDDAFEQSHGTIQVGFNRRFAPASLALRRLLNDTPGPTSASFRVMAGRLDPAHWYANHAESGGRVLGEACHFLDYFCFLFERDPVRVLAQPVWPAAGKLPFPDSITAQVEFADGSSGQLIYTAEGDPTWPKEVCTVFGAGWVAELENFQTLTVCRQRKATRTRFNGKGHAEQMAAWLAYLKAAAPHPLPYAVSRRSMLLTFAVLDSIRLGTAISLAPEIATPAGFPVRA